MSKLVSVAFAAAAAFAVVSTSTPLFAAGPALVYKTAAVGYGDLNLASAEGQKLLHSRVRAAVRKVCGVEKGVAIKHLRAVQDCRTETMASARSQMNQAFAGARPRIIVAASR